MTFAKKSSFLAGVVSKIFAMKMCLKQKSKVNKHDCSIIIEIKKINLCKKKRTYYVTLTYQSGTKTSFLKIGMLCKFSVFCQE